jgi:membrane associated rhomboid family serine protease
MWARAPAIIRHQMGFAMKDQALKAREPAFNSPWPALVMPVAILVAYAAQGLAGGRDEVAEAFGFSPAALGDGRWSSLLTAMFVHASWSHVGLNALGALAFGAPVARWIGVRGLGPLIFLTFYLLCGVLGSLGFALIHAGATVVLVGASGAVYGLMGAASRMLGVQGPASGLAPFSSPTVVGFAVGCIVINALMAVVGAPGLAVGGPIAWEAHLFGYASGLLLIGPLLRLRRSQAV